MRRIALALLLLGFARALRLPPPRMIDRRTALASLGGCCAPALFALTGAARATASVPEEGFIFEEDLKDGLQQTASKQAVFWEDGGRQCCLFDDAMMRTTEW